MLGSSAVDILRHVSCTLCTNTNSHILITISEDSTCSNIKLESYVRPGFPKNGPSNPLEGHEVIT